MALSQDIKNRVGLTYLKVMDTKIGRAKKFENANAMAFQVLDYFRYKDFDIKIETTKMTGEWEVTLLASRDKNEPILFIATGHNLWSGVRSILFHFLKG